MRKDMRGNDSEIGKAVTGLIFFTMLAKLMGFFREILLSYFFGATGISDAYLISQTIPGTIFQFVGTGLMTCYVPIYYKILHRDGEKYTHIYTNRVLSLVLVFAVGIILLIWSSTQLFVKIFASGFWGSTLYYAKIFTRISALSLIFSSFVYVYTSYLQVHNVFVPSAYAAIPNSLVVMLSIYAGARWNVWLLSIGSAFAIAVQLLVLTVPVRRLKYRFCFDLKFTDSNMQEFFVLLIPVIVGVSINEINVLIDRTLASKLAVGGISALTYAASLINMIQGGLIQPIITVCFPKITKTVAAGKNEESRQLFQEIFMLLLAILIPVSGAFMVYSRQLTQFLFGRGAFDKEAVRLTSEVLKFYAASISFIGIRELLSRYFYAYKDTKTPMINTSVGVGINILGNLLLSQFFGISGLAISTSLSALVTVIMLLFSLRQLPVATGIYFGKELFVILVCTGISLACSKGSYIFLTAYEKNIGEDGMIFAAMAVVPVIYIICSFALNPLLVKRIKKFAKR